jgi:hypothetical protein
VEPLPLAPHLGWESEGFVRAQQAAVARRARALAYQAAQSYCWSPPQSATAPDRPARTLPVPPGPGLPSQETTGRKPDPSVRIYPDLAVAMLRQGRVAAGRLWLLLQHLDRAGKGWVREADARAHLSGSEAPLRLCGWRQLRNLLAEGDGLFWQRDAGAGEPRIWLASSARVALRLDVGRVRLEPVSLPLSVLLDGIGTVRAHFYASFHSSRQARPISRATLAALTAVSARSQRTYEVVAGVRCQANWVIGPAQQESDGQELAWQHGQALFTFTDRRGSYGRPGSTYYSWQLPNSYRGPHAMQGRSPQKALSQQLVDLYSKGVTGNGKQGVEAALPQSRFYDNGQAAVRALHRGQSGDAYWLTSRFERHYQIWHYLPVYEAAS